MSRYKVEQDPRGFYRVYDMQSGTIATDMTKQNAEAFCKMKNDQEPTKTVKILGHELPLPESKAPGYGQQYFYLNLEMQRGYSSSCWCDDDMDENVFTNKGVFLNESDVKSWVKFWREEIIRRIMEVENDS